MQTMKTRHLIHSSTHASSSPLEPRQAAAAAVPDTSSSQAAEAEGEEEEWRYLIQSSIYAFNTCIINSTYSEHGRRGGEARRRGGTGHAGTRAPTRVTTPAHSAVLRHDTRYALLLAATRKTQRRTEGVSLPGAAAGREA